MGGAGAFVGVGGAAKWLRGFGYECFFIHAMGLIPLEAEGTPSGERARADCGEGLPSCARWRLYDRLFWGSVAACNAHDPDSKTKRLPV